VIRSTMPAAMHAGKTPSGLDASSLQGALEGLSA
jgi:hypothetical protein